MGVFGEEALEEGPATVAALVHVIALHELLDGEQRHFLTVFQFETGLNHLGERGCVAGATLTLITNSIGEIEAIDVLIVVYVRDLAVGNLIRSLVLFAPVLCLGEDFLELFAIFTEPAC